MTSEDKKLIERAARLCSGSEKCRHDIKVKLLSWGMNEENVIVALNELEKQHFIDDQRYAGFFVKDKLKFNKWGSVKIRYALKQKMISDTIINEALASLDLDLYNDILLNLLKNKKKALGGIETAEKRAKLIRFAAQKGFTMEEVYDMIAKLE